MPIGEYVRDSVSLQLVKRRNEDDDFFVAPLLNSAITSRDVVEHRRERSEVERDVIGESSSGRVSTTRLLRASISSRLPMLTKFGSMTPELWECNPLPRIHARLSWCVIRKMSAFSGDRVWLKATKQLPAIRAISRSRPFAAFASGRARRRRRWCARGTGRYPLFRLR